ATEVFPAAGVLVAAVLCLAGTLWLAAERQTEPPVVRAERHHRAQGVPAGPGRPVRRGRGNGWGGGAPRAGGAGPSPVGRAAGGRGRGGGGPAPGLVVLVPMWLLLGAMFVSIDLST